MGTGAKIGPSTTQSRDLRVIFAALRGSLMASDTPPQDLGTTDHVTLRKIKSINLKDGLFLVTIMLSQRTYICNLRDHNH